MGKTTCAVNVAACLARARHEVLLIDLDPQANLTVHVDMDPTMKEGTIYNVLTGECELEDAVHEVEGEYFDFVPSNMDLSGIEVELASTIGREMLLKKALEKYVAERGEYDYVLIDCPPSLGLLVLNALTTVNEVFIPIQAQFFALHGLSRILDVIRLAQERLNSSLEISGIIPCMYDSRTNLSKEVLGELNRHFGEKVYNTLIRSNIRLAEAPSHGKSIFGYAPSSAGAKDFISLCRELRRREKKKEREAEEKTRMVSPPPEKKKPEHASNSSISDLSEEEIRSAMSGDVSTDAHQE